MRRRGTEAVDVVMPPNELAKASASASKHFFLMLLGMQADGGCTHLAFTGGSKVGADASRDGAAHVACGVFEGASLVCGATQGDYNYNYVSKDEPNAFRAYGCGLPAEAEVPDAEMAGIILFLERCVCAAEAVGAEPVHAIVAVDSEACLVDIEIAWRSEDARALAPRNRAALLETICALRKRLVAMGGSSRLVWCPAHVGIYGNLAADAVAKAFLYEPAMEPTLHVRRSVHIQTLRSGATSYALPADRRPFRLMRKRLWEAEVQRQLPAALSKRPRWAAGAGSAATEGVGEEAEAEGGQWMGMWPILDPAALGAGAAVGDAPRWQAVVEETSRGARGGEGTRHQPSATGIRFMLRSGGTLDGLFGLACCPLCGLAGAPLDLRHVLGGECTEGATSEERAHAVTLLSGLGAALPLQADVHKDAGEHDAAMGRESQRAVRVFGTVGAAGPRSAAGDEEWWMAARFVSGMPPALGPGARARILAAAEEKEHAAPVKKRVGLVKARAAALLAAKDTVLGVLEKLAYHLAAVVGRWRGRLAGREVEPAGRGGAAGPGPHGAP